MNDNIRFYDLDDGSIVEIKTLNYSDIDKCPNFIMLPSHYREDKTCRCNEIICEMDNCLNPKSIRFDEDENTSQEIYCEKHLEGY